ncbi:unnamed protein product [Microthlaspi erraticum]|uniref:Retrotransposon Copia-like N-terminal domain-containing protein n=1 Tax=Microthlaspi erraticum TaxID=1685480 RepID=A0A6D2IC07_9BRAS|nr:unnamed protein product [Microthlaspi erraticum]
MVSEQKISYLKISFDICPCSVWPEMMMFLRPGSSGALAVPSSVEWENYNEWASELYNALQAKRKTGFIQGVLPNRRAIADLENWLTANSMLVGWIRSSIEPKVRSTVSYISDAYLLWTELKERFSVGNKVRVHQIKAQLASCRQEGQTVLEYYGRLSTLWEDYNRINQ